MTLRNEIFEGLAAAKASRDLVWDPQRNYAEEMYKVARRENQDVEERDQARAATIAAGRPTAPANGYQLPTTASTAMPGTTDQSALILGPPSGKMPTSALAPVMPRMPMRTPRFAEGGMVEDENTDLMPPFDPEGDDYDYRTARLAGIKRGPDGHMASRDPTTGMQLKGRAHPTFDKAIETDRLQGYGLEKQNGRYYTQKFADGGMVDDPDDPDLIVRSLINRQVGMPGETNDIGGPALPQPDFRSEGNRQLDERNAGEKINRETDEPWTVPGASSEYYSQGVRDRTQAQEDARTIAADQTQGAAMDTGPAPPAPRSRLERATDWMKPDPLVGAMTTRRKQLRREVNQAEPGLTEQLTDEELRAREAKAAGLREEIGKTRTYGAPSMPAMPDVTVPSVNLGAVNTGTFTPPMGPAAIPREAPAAPGADTTPTARRQINETGGTPEGSPPQGPYPGVPNDQPQPAAPQLPPTPVPGPNTAQAQGDRPTGNVRQPNQTPAPVAVATNGAAVPATSNGPPNTSQSGPTGTASAAPPPTGSAGVNAPSTAPKPVQQALNAAPPPAMRGGLGDQSRTKAYDPVADANDPGNKRAVDAGGRAYSPQEIQQVLGAAASVAKSGPNGEPPPVGQGTISRPTFQAYVDKNSQGGKFSPGEAMLAGMMSDYKMLLKQGRIQQANMMAYGLIQAASIEAAAHGRVAGDQLKQGNYGAALNSVVKGANYLPDGLTFAVGPDGKSIVATNGAGEVTGQQPVTPQQILAMVTGLADGTLLWQALQASASALTKPDRNAEGRQLSNQIKRNNLTLQEMRIKKGLGGGGGGAAGPSSAASEISQRLAALGGGAPQPTTVVVNQQGSDDGGIVNEAAEIPDD